MLINRTVGLLLSLSILLGGLLTGCQTSPPPKAPTPQSSEQPAAEPAQVEQPAKPARTPMEPNQRVIKALELIQQGDFERAQQQLEWTLEDAPNQRLAQKLLLQLTADPVAVLGTQSFDYTVKPGESLSLIAKEHLDDSLQFIVLARYNDIKNPSKLAAGQVLKIPGKPAPPAAEQPDTTDAVAAEQDPSEHALESARSDGEPVAEAPLATDAEEQPPSATANTDDSATQALDAGASSWDADAIYEQAKQLFHAKDYNAAAATIMAHLDAGGSSNERLEQLLFEAYTQQAERDLDKRQWLEARDALRLAAALDPEDAAVKRQLVLVEDRIAAEAAYKTALSLEQQGDLAAAYDKLLEAKVYDAQNEAIDNTLNDVRKRLADQYHRKAVRHFGRQELEQAKSYWQKVLVVDPDNELAPGYISRVEDIQRSLENIE